MNLQYEYLDDNVHRFWPVSGENLIAESSVTAPAAGEGTVQLFRLNGLGGAAAKTAYINTVTQLEFLVSHNETESGTYEWRVNGIEVASGGEFNPMKVRFNL